jgi:hypothetical protein
MGLTAGKVSGILDDMTTTHTTANQPIQFEVGRTYWCRSIADYDCVWEFTVTKRTARFITIVDKHGEERRVGVSVWAPDNEERAKPLGTFSMSPTLTASRESLGVITD